MNPLLSAFAQWAEALANGSVALDPVAAARLQRLAGRSIRFENDLDPPITVEFDEARIHVLARSTEQPSAIVTGSPLALLAASAGSRVGGELRVEGDELLVDEFRSILTELRPDFSEPLGRLIGDEPAQAFAGFVELGSKALGEMLGALAKDGTDTLRAGAHHRYLDRASLERFSEDTLSLQLAVDRLGARIRAFEADRQRAAQASP